MVIRVKKENNFTIIPNSLLKDKRLSLKAKGLLCQLLSFPESWDYSISGLSQVTGEGKTSIRSALDCLDKAGYVERKFIREESGKFLKQEWTIYEMSKLDTNLPESGFPPADNPSPGNGHNKELTNQELTNQGRNNEEVSGIIRFPDYIHFSNLFYALYKEYTGEEHPTLKKEQSIKVAQAITNSPLLDCTEEQQRMIITDYLLTVRGDHNINHFASGKIIQKRIERYNAGLCFSDSTLDNEVEIYRGTGRFDEEYLDFLELYADYYRKYQGESHPAVRLDYLDKYYSNILCTLDGKFYEPEEVLEDFFSTPKRSDYRLGYFASEEVLNITNYRSM
jgi:hypothetical protein